MCSSKCLIKVEFFKGQFRNSYSISGRSSLLRGLLSFDRNISMESFHLWKKNNRIMSNKVDRRKIHETHLIKPTNS